MRTTNGGVSVGKIFFTADTHFGHANIIKYCNRPFLTDLDRKALEENGGSWHDGSWKGTRSSDWRITRDAVDMMNDTITDNINKMVGENDTLWHLGDFAFGVREKYVHKCEFYRSRIKCKNVNIIWGNHDEPHKIRHLFKEAYDLHNIQNPVNRSLIVLCHYALAVWDGSHRKNIHLYGHSHSGAEGWLDKHLPNRLSMDVGVDNAAKLLGSYRPFSIDDIMRLIGGRNGHNVGDHHIDPNTPKEEELV